MQKDIIKVNETKDTGRDKLILKIYIHNCLKIIVLLVDYYFISPGGL